MKANTQYIASDGYEYFMCPFTNMNITQGSNTDYSHNGVMANDVTNGDTSMAPYYAPCTCQCFVVYSSSGQSSWVSVNPVHLANGYFGYVMFTIAHDESQDCYVGQVVNQGSQIGNMGAKGIGTGVHCHIQVGVGNDCQWGYTKGYWVYDGVTYPTYGFSNEPYDLDDCYFVDDTNIIYGAGGNWKTTGGASISSSSSASSSLSFSDMEEETYGIKFTVSGVSIRKDSTDGSVVGFTEEGDCFTYTRKGIANGYRYVGFNSEQFGCNVVIAYCKEDRSDPWAEICDPSCFNSTTETVKANNDYTSNIKHYGIDIYSGNGDVDLSKYEFAILQCSYGVVEDTMLKANVDKCVAAGMPYGLYVYDYANCEQGGTDQAKFVLELINKYNLNPTLGIWIDEEDSDGWKAANNVLTKESISTIVKAFYKVISEAGYYCGIYSTRHWQNTYFDEECQRIPLWCAQWGINDGNVNCDVFDASTPLLQYTSVPQDLNAMYVDYDYFKTEVNAGDVPSSEESSSHDSNENNLAGVVINESTENCEAENSHTSLFSLLINFLKKILSLFGIK